MLNSSVFSYSPDLKESLIEREIINRITLLAHFLQNRGYEVASYSEKAFNKLSSASPEKKVKALDQLKNLDWLYARPMGFIEPELPHDNIHPERYLVEKAMSFYNLGLRDDFWKTVEPHDIIEIYNDEGIQVFRTFNFFNTSGYSLTDLLINEWYVLWERPKFVLQEIFKYSEGILSGTMKGVTKMTVPEHIVKEIYSGNEEMLDFTPRSLLVQFGDICPLYNSKDSSEERVRGIIVSSTCRTNTMGSEETKKVVIF